MRVRVPEASACAVSDSVSGPVSAPSCPGLGSRPWTSSFTVYTNNSIYKGITPEERRMREALQTCDYDLFMSPCTCLVHLNTTSSNCLMAYCLVGGGASSGIKKTASALFPQTPERRWQRVFFSPFLRQCLKPKLAAGLTREARVPRYTGAAAHRAYKCT